MAKKVEEEKKVVSKKTTAKIETKTVAKKETKKEETKAEPKKTTTEKKEGSVKVYHVSKRASDNKWQVFIRGSEKVIKLFTTKAEAEEYCVKMAKNQNATLQVHKSKGVNKGKISKAVVKGTKK